MPYELDIKKLVKYPPEVLLQARPVDLSKGSNIFAEYPRGTFVPRIIALDGVSFARYDGLSFHVDVDGHTDVVTVAAVGAAKGLNYEEEVKVPATMEMVMRFIAPAAISAYQVRYKLWVGNPTTILKMLLGIPLDVRDKELAAKYGLTDELALLRPPPFNPYQGLEMFKTVTARMTASGTIFRLTVPDGYKAVILDIAGERPASSAQAYVHIERDDWPATDDVGIDLYCLQGLSPTIGVWPRYAMRIVALDRLLVELDGKGSGTYKVRLGYGLGKITVPEKIKWGITLTPEEE